MILIFPICFLSSSPINMTYILGLYQMPKRNKHVCVCVCAAGEHWLMMIMMIMVLGILGILTSLSDLE